MYSSLETHARCSSDWTTLCQAMPQQFGSLIHAKKANAVLLQMMQDKMAILQYTDAFESYLVQLEDYDASFHFTKFIFSLRPTILAKVFVQRSVALLEAKMRKKLKKMS